MHGTRTMLTGLAAALLAFGAAPAMAQGPREIEAPAGPWTTPRGVAVTFPDRIGDYRRVRIVEYSADDWSAGYTLIRDGHMTNTVTVYVYAEREGLSCDAEFRGSMAAIDRAYAGAIRVSEDVADSPRGGVPGAAQQAHYAFTTQYDGAEKNLSSMLYMYCRPGSHWWVKARATWPEELDRQQDVPTILRAITWPAEVAD